MNRLRLRRLRPEHSPRRDGGVAIDYRGESARRGKTAPRSPGVGAAITEPMPSDASFITPDRDWFDRPALAVARDLLGARLTRRSPEGAVTVRLVEVEAYDGANDPGSHAFTGQTARNATMFGPGGHLYVYRHMGLHHCVNIVCGSAGRASAVLLRAGEVVDGLELARARRAAAGVTRHDRDLAQGPARLTVALGITRDDDGADLLEPGGRFVLQVVQDCASVRNVLSGPRVGVSGDGGRADLFPWRFWLDGAPEVSAYRPAQRRNRR